MGCLWSEGDEVPKHVRVLEVRLRIALLRVDEARKEKRVADEEDRSVVADQIPVALLRVELHREAARITSGVCGTALPSDGREADQHRRLLADLLKYLRLRKLGDIMSHLATSKKLIADVLLSKSKEPQC